MRKKIFLMLMASVMVCLAFTILVSAQEHSLNESLAYENGFTSNGVYSCVCTCGDAQCSYNVANEITAPMFIMNGSEPEILYRLLDGEQVGTYFVAKS